MQSKDKLGTGWSNVFRTTAEATLKNILEDLTAGRVDHVEYIRTWVKFMLEGTVKKCAFLFKTIKEVEKKSQGGDEAEAGVEYLFKVCYHLLLLHVLRSLYWLGYLPVSAHFHHPRLPYHRHLQHPRGGTLEGATKRSSGALNTRGSTPSPLPPSSLSSNTFPQAQRALERWETGSFQRKAKGEDEFSKNNWSEPAEDLVPVINKLADAQWDEIIAAAVASTKKSRRKAAPVVKVEEEEAGVDGAPEEMSDLEDDF